MKRQLLSLFFVIAGINVLYAQVFTCPELEDDMAQFNAATQRSDVINWALTIKESKQCKLNSDGILEYVYILKSNDSFDIATLRNIGFEFINYYFPNIGAKTSFNVERSYMETNSPKDGIIFKCRGKPVEAKTESVVTTRIYPNYMFDIRFKPDRIRFSIKVATYYLDMYSFARISSYSSTVYVHNVFPLSDWDFEKTHFSTAFINTVSRCISQTSAFLKYMNRHIVENQPTEADDW